MNFMEREPVCMEVLSLFHLVGVVMSYIALLWDPLRAADTRPVSVYWPLCFLLLWRHLSFPQVFIRERRVSSSHKNVDESISREDYFQSFCSYRCSRLELRSFDSCL